MKVTINGKVTKDILNSILSEQKNKLENIKAFCKTEKMKSLSYKDAELDVEIINDNTSRVKTKAKPKKVEVEKR